MRMPECPARHIDDTTGQISCLHPQVHAAGCVVTAEFCRMCSARLVTPPSGWRSLDEVRRSRRRLEPCRFLGMQSGERDCPTCNGRVRIKVYACRHESHEETTLRECQTCADHQSVS